MNGRKGTICLWMLTAVSPALAVCAGCLQIETRILLHPDGSATITERVQFSRKLLSLGTTVGADLDVAPLLEKKAVLDRMKHMGKDIRLVSHVLRPGDAGSKESLTVFKIPGINEFRYASPFLAYTDYAENNLVQCRMVPLLKSRSYIGRAGEMAVSFQLLKRPKPEARPKEGEAEPPGPSPAELQLARELGPAFRDMMRGFKIKLTFESYSPITGSGIPYRGFREGAHDVDVISFCDEDQDRFGSKFLENEEVMLDLFRGKVGSANVVEHVRGYRDNPTVPVFQPWGSRFSWWTGGQEICCRPSKTLFDRYFAGKKLDYSRWRKSPPEKLVPARFEEIGYRPKPATKPPAQ